MLLEAKCLFDGQSNTPQADQAVLLVNGRIAALGDGARAAAGQAPVVQVAVLAPGFIDMQINGANGVLFNATPTTQGLHTMMQGARQGGSAYCLPTYITAAGSDYTLALAACAQALHDGMGVAGVLGVHLEGPFLSRQRAGIHQRAAIRTLSTADMNLLCRPFTGARIITVAPECVEVAQIRALCAAGWVVWAGHTEASWDCMQAAQEAGLRGCTHLFNAMPALTSRVPGVVGAVLSSDSLVASVIADGIHVHAANLRLAYKALGAQRLCLVSDAMPTLGSNIDSFTLDGRTIYRQGKRLSDAHGTLAGAHLPMDQAVRNMVDMAGASRADALRMASSAPAQLLGLDAQLGYVLPGYRAGLTVLNDQLHAQAVVVDGQFFPLQGA
jgi:N-acetylglucosamine-6-phosphate deacetylase